MLITTQTKDLTYQGFIGRRYMNVLSIIEIIGTIAFVTAGALSGIQKQLDVFGVFMLALTTAVGAVSCEMC